jgi:hypothetical protein
MTRTIFIAAALALAVTLPAAPAQALVARTFVSAAGSDSNNCANVLTPCRHLATAYAATSPNGEIYVLDPANYGSLTITGPVSIEGHGWASIAPVANNPAITINANPGDKINIIGVVLDGTGIGATTGIRFNSGGTLTVRDSLIRNFTNNGISFVPMSSSNFVVSNTVISDNGPHGIFISDNGSGTTNGVLNHVEMENNEFDGLIAQSDQTVNITISDSVSANNGNIGILNNPIGTVPSNILVRSSTIANNTAGGLEAINNGATLRVTRSTITGNGSGWISSGAGAVVLSYGDNNIDGNTSVNTEPPGPLTYK